MKNQHKLSARDEAINAWLDRTVAALERLVINPLLGKPPELAPVAIARPSRIQPPRRRAVKLWLARRILFAIRRDLTAVARQIDLPRNGTPVSLDK